MTSSTYLLALIVFGFVYWKHACSSGRFEDGNDGVPASVLEVSVVAEQKS